MYDYPTGRILTSFASRAEREKIIASHGFPGKRWANINSEKKLEEECARVRDEKLLTRYSDEGVASYAVPVFFENSLLGTVGVYMPLFRKTREKEKLIREKLLTFSL